MKDGLTSRGILSIAAILTSSVLRIGVLSILSRLLTDNDYGQYVLLLSITMVTSGLLACGIPNIVMRWGAIAFSSGSYLRFISILRNTYIWFLCVYAILFLVSFNIYPVVSGYLGIKIKPDTFILIGLSGLLIISSEILASLARATERVLMYFSIKEFLPLGCQLVFIGFLVVAEPSHDIAYQTFLLGYSVSLAASVYLLRRILFVKYNLDYDIDKDVRKEIFFFGGFVAIVSLVNILKDRTLVFFISGHVGFVEAGQYFNASRMAILITIILSGFNAVLGPRLAVLLNKSDKSGVTFAYQTTVRHAIILTMAPLTALILCPDLIMLLIFDDGTELGTKLLLVLAFARAISLLVGSPGLALQMNGRPNAEAYGLGVNVLLLIVLCSFLLPRFGLWGAVIPYLFLGFLLDFYKGVAVYLSMGLLALSKQTMMAYFLYIMLLAIFLYFLPPFDLEFIYPRVFLFISSYILMTYALLTNDERRLIISFARLKFKRLGS